MKRIAYLLIFSVLFIVSCAKETEVQDTGTGTVEASISYQQDETFPASPDASAMTFLIRTNNKKWDLSKSNIKIGEIWFEGENKLTKFDYSGFADAKGISTTEKVANGKYIYVVRSLKMYSTTYTEIEVKDNKVTLSKVFKKFDSQNESW